MPETKPAAWCLPRHRRICALARGPIWLLTHLSYPVKIEKQKSGEQALILFNHQTALDQFLVGLAFPQPIYYVASEDLFSIGFLARAMEYAVAPIPIKKQATDIRAVKTCLRVAKEGGSIAIAPEGNRTYSGRTCYMNPAIGSLAKKLGLPVLLFRIEGGYGVHPRWSDKVRRGPMRAFVAERIEPEELKRMRPEEVYDRIRLGLQQDENRSGGIYRGGRRAEYLERMLYLCPRCGPSKLESHGSRIRCPLCGLEAEYGEDKRFHSADPGFPYQTAGDWYDAQEAWVNGLEPAEHTETPLFRDEASKTGGRFFCLGSEEGTRRQGDAKTRGRTFCPT